MIIPVNVLRLTTYQQMSNAFLNAEMASKLMIRAVMTATLLAVMAVVLHVRLRQIGLVQGDQQRVLQCAWLATPLQ